MSIVLWNDRYAINNEQIDNQHRRLIQLLNNLHESLLAGESSEEALLALDHLVAYARFHFGEEERLLSDSGSLQLPRHKEEHGRLLERLNDLAGQLTDQRVAIEIDLVAFVRSWLAEHVAVHDAAIGVAEYQSID